MADAINEILQQTVESLYVKAPNGRWKSRVTGVTADPATTNLLNKACNRRLEKCDEYKMSECVMCDPVIELIPRDRMHQSSFNMSLTLDPNTHQPFWTDGLGKVTMIENVIYTSPFTGDIATSNEIANTLKTQK